jgi:hypothetical protein
MRVAKQLENEGVIKAFSRRAAGPGTLLVLRGESMQAMRTAINTNSHLKAEVLRWQARKPFLIATSCSAVTA